MTVASGDLDWNNQSTWIGALVRCPCGNGTCAEMAVLHAKSELKISLKFRRKKLIFK